jgi:hypothetical protein
MADKPDALTYQYLYGGGGGGHKGTGASALYERITDAQIKKVCAMIAEGVPILAAFRKNIVTSASAILRARRAGEAAIKKWEEGKDIDPKTGLLQDETEAAAMRFGVLLAHAMAEKVEGLTHRALCNFVEYTSIDGKKYTADINGAKQAQNMLGALPPIYGEVEGWEIEDSAPTATREPTDDEREAHARAYLASKGIPWPEAAEDAYDPTDAAPAQKL